MPVKTPRKKVAPNRPGRNTTQREAIERVFLEEDRPLGVEEVLRSGRRRVGSLNQATVYRNLKILVESGWLIRVNAPDLGVLYERSGKEHHHHFRCRNCDRLFELPGCALQKETVPPGFVAEGHEVILFGVCSSCRKRKAGRIP